MQILTAYSTTASTVKACEEVISQLHHSSHASPSLLLCYYTDSYCASQIAKSLHFAFENTQILGCSSRQGVMTDQGFHSKNNAGLGVWAIWDPNGAYGTGIEYYCADSCVNSCEDQIEPELAAQVALDNALKQAGREGELPDLIWLHATPGYEERVIAGLQDILGDHVPIAGGSSADNLMNENWTIMAGGQVEIQGIALAVLFPGGEIGYSFHSGYVANRALGTVTASNFRTILTIDDNPAAQVYRDAILQLTSDAAHPIHSSDTFTFFPLGREAGYFDKFPLFKLSHPYQVTEEHGLTVFSDIQVGDRLYLMEGTRQSLISRAAEVTKACLDARPRYSEPIGSLVIYCVACMQAVRDDMDSVVVNVRDSLGEGRPFIGAFTFGEQGRFISGGNGHGNLMLSSVVFYQDSHRDESSIHRD